MLTLLFIWLAANIVFVLIAMLRASSREHQRQRRNERPERPAPARRPLGTASLPNRGTASLRDRGTVRYPLSQGALRRSQTAHERGDSPRNRAARTIRSVRPPLA